MVGAFPKNADDEKLLPHRQSTARRRLHYRAKRVPEIEALRGALRPAGSEQACSFSKIFDQAACRLPPRPSPRPTISIGARMTLSNLAKLLTVLALALVSPASAGIFTIMGDLVDRGIPIDGGVISFQYASAITNSKGQFFVQLPPNVYEISVAVPSRPGVHYEASVELGEVISRSTLLLSSRSSINPGKRIGGASLSEPIRALREAGTIAIRRRPLCRFGAAGSAEHLPGRPWELRPCDHSRRNGAGRGRAWADRGKRRPDADCEIQDRDVGEAPPNDEGGQRPRRGDGAEANRTH